MRRKLTPYDNEGRCNACDVEVQFRTGNNPNGFTFCKEHRWLNNRLVFVGKELRISYGHSKPTLTIKEALERGEKI
jgi:hypothetical protein